MEIGDKVKYVGFSMLPRSDAEGTVVDVLSHMSQVEWDSGGTTWHMNIWLEKIPITKATDTGDECKCDQCSSEFTVTTSSDGDVTFIPTNDNKGKINFNLPIVATRDGHRKEFKARYLGRIRKGDEWQNAVAILGNSKDYREFVPREPTHEHVILVDDHGASKIGGGWQIHGTTDFQMDVIEGWVNVIKEVDIGKLRFAANVHETEEKAHRSGRYLGDSTIFKYITSMRISYPV